MSTSRSRLLVGSAPLVLAKAAASQVFGQVTVGVDRSREDTTEVVMGYDPAKKTYKVADVMVRVR